LAPYFVEEPDDVGNMLYPRYLGHPIELVEVIEEDEYAEVVWNATAHTAFSLSGERRTPGATITLKTRLQQVESFWKVLKLHDGGKNDSQ
jgi:hypothetical protein